MRNGETGNDLDGKNAGGQVAILRSRIMNLLLPLEDGRTTILQR
jgi:hypothetical protein